MLPYNHSWPEQKGPETDQPPLKWNPVPSCRGVYRELNPSFSPKAPSFLNVPLYWKHLEGGGRGSYGEITLLGTQCLVRLPSLQSFEKKKKSSVVHKCSASNWFTPASLWSLVCFLCNAIKMTAPDSSCDATTRCFPAGDAVPRPAWFSTEPTWAVFLAELGPRGFDEMWNLLALFFFFKCSWASGAIMGCRCSAAQDWSDKFTLQVSFCKAPGWISAHSCNHFSLFVCQIFNIYGVVLPSIILCGTTVEFMGVMCHNESLKHGREPAGERINCLFVTVLPISHLLTVKRLRSSSAE